MKIEMEGLTSGDMHSMASKARALPHQSTLLGQQWGHVPAYQLIRHGLVAVRIELALVAHIPCSACGAVVVALGLLCRFEASLFGIEGVAVLVFGAADGSFAASCVYLEDGVVGAINVGIHTQTEEVLVVMCVDSWVDFGPPAVEILTRVHGVCVQDSGELDLQLDSAVLVQDPVHAVLVVGCREDVGNDELTCASDSHALIPEVSVLEENAVVLLVDADGILNRGCHASAIDEVCIEVMYGTLAIATQAQGVGHVATTILTQIERMLALVWVLRVAVWNYHFSQG